VLRLDPLTRRTVIVPDIETGQPPVVQVTVGAGAVWATTTAGPQLLRIDPRTARATASLSVPPKRSPPTPPACGRCVAVPAAAAGGSPASIRAAGS
jgi:streptogramin lyase